MARTIRDLALAYSLLAGPDGADGFSIVPREFDAGLGASPDRPVRVGWLVDSGLGPIDPEVAATVQEAADALQGAGVRVDAVSIPALERDNPLELWTRQHVMEVKPAFRKVTAGHEDQMFTLLQVPGRHARHVGAGLRPGRAGRRAAPGRLSPSTSSGTTCCCSR